MANKQNNSIGSGIPTSQIKQKKAFNVSFVLAILVLVALASSLYLLYSSYETQTSLSQQLNFANYNSLSQQNTISALNGKLQTLQTQLNSTDYQLQQTQMNLSGTWSNLSNSRNTTQNELKSILQTVNSTSYWQTYNSVQSNYTESQNYACNFYFGGSFSTTIYVPLGCTLAMGNLLNSLNQLYNMSNVTGPQAASAMIENYITNNTN